MISMDRKLVISCEHSGNKVPSKYEHLFDINPEVLNTHRGYDIGALELTTTISKTLDVEAHVHNVSRLLIDLNRSLNNPAAFSEYMDEVDQDTRQSIIEEYYLPHRKKVRQIIGELISDGQPVLHLSVHTFTPQMDGVKRNADIGILYDPKRETEKEFCQHWKRQLEELMSGLKYRMNYPYPGTMDGFSTSLRKELSQEEYWGIELEVNQKFAESNDEQRWKNIQLGIAKSLKLVFENS